MANTATATLSRPNRPRVRHMSALPSDSAASFRSADVKRRQQVGQCQVQIVDHATDGLVTIQSLSDEHTTCSAGNRLCPLPACPVRATACSLHLYRKCCPRRSQSGLSCQCRSAFTERHDTSRWRSCVRP
jgi:hypothetical protein